MSDSMNDVTEDFVEETPSYARSKRNCLVFLLAWAIVWGFVGGAASVNWGTAIVFLDAVMFLIAIVRWTYLDAAEHDFQLWRHFVTLLVICPGPVVIMPVYFIRSRGWRAGLIACGLALAFWVLQIALHFWPTYVVALLT